MRSVFELRSTRARVVTISHTYSPERLGFASAQLVPRPDVGSPAPCSRQSRRKAAVVMPAVGASTTGGSAAYGPMDNGTSSRMAQHARTGPHPPSHDRLGAARPAAGPAPGPAVGAGR